MSKVYDPFYKDEISQKDNWWTRTTATMATIVITGAAIRKLKGPVGSLAMKYFNQQNNINVQREIQKQLDRQEYEIGSGATIHQKGFGNQIDEGLKKQRLKEIEEIDKQQARVLARKAGHTEYILVKRGLTDINQNDNKNNIKQNKNNLSMTFTPSDVKMDIREVDELFFQLRKESMFEFLSRNLGLNNSDRATLENWNNEKLFGKDLADLHEQYLYNEREYAEIYNRNLSRMFSIYKVQKAVFDAQPINQTYTKEDFKNRLYGGFNETPEAAAEQLRLARYVPKPTQTINVFEELGKSGCKITSGSLNQKVPLTDNKQFKILGHFDYTPLLKKIGEQIKELTNPEGRANKCKISSINFEIISQSDFKKQQYFLKLTFHHSSKINKEYSILTPLSQHGFIPGSTPSIGIMLDGLYLKEETLVRRITNRYGGIMDLKINEDLENKTQQMLRLLSNRLDSNMMENEFSIDPGKFIGRLSSDLNRMLSDTPLAEGNIRDTVKMLAIRNPGTYSTKNSLRTLSRAMISMNNMKRIADLSKNNKSSSIITLDFETISRDIPGPEWIVKDSHTEVTKVGFSTSRYHNGKLNIVDVDDIISDHAVGHMEQYGVTKETTDWLRKELGENIAKDKSKDEIWSLWRDKIRKEASNYKYRNNGRSFANNVEMVRHTANTLLQKIKSEALNGNEVYITTKNSPFDLHIIESWAPHEWQEIKKYVNFIDVQSVASFQNKLLGKDDSLALNKIIMNMIGGKNNFQYDIDTPGNAQRAFDSVKNKVPITVNDNVNNLIKQRNYMRVAHGEPVADIMFENVMLADQLHKIMSGEKSFENLDEISKFYLSGKRIKGIDETFLEYQMLEKSWSVNGMMASASALSHGNIAKKMVSLISLNMLLPLPENSLGKQWDQLFIGVHVRPKNIDSIRDRINLVDRKIKDRYWTPTFISQGEIDATNYLLKSQDYENYFSHHIYAKGVALWNPWRGKEGFFALSNKVFDNYTMHFKKTLDLTDSVTSAKDIGIRHKDFEVVEMIRKYALQNAKVGGYGQPNIEHYEVATKQVMNELSKGKEGIPLPKGAQTLISRGDKSYEVVQEEFGGLITNILVDADIHNKIRIQAQVEYMANGPELLSQTMNVRSLVSKAALSKDHLLSQGLAYGGVEAVMNAEFMEKNYVGAQKQVLLEKIMDKLIDERDNARNSFDREKAEQNIKRLALKTHSEVKGITFSHDPYKTSVFKNITNPNDIETARKFLGNIDISMKEIGSFMADAGIIWDQEQARNWYKMVGGNDIVRGRKKMEEWVTGAINNAHKEIDKELDATKGVLRHLDKTQITNLKDDATIVLKDWFLPDLDKIAQGVRIPKFFEPVRRDTNPDTPFDIGFFHRSRITPYGLMKGRNITSKNLKFRGNLFQQIDTPFSHVSTYTLDHLKRNRRGFIDKRFRDALNTYDNFKDALMSKATVNVGDLTIDEIRTLNDSLGRMKLEDVKRWNLTDEKAESIKKTLTEKFMVEYGDGDWVQEIDAIINDMQSDRFAQQFKDSKRFISSSAAEAIARLGEKKKVFSYSKRKELGGSFTFELRDLLLNSGIPEEELPVAQQKLISGFKAISKQPNSIVESIDELGKDGPVIKLKKLIMHADASPQNVYNLLNPMGGTSSFGFLSIPNQYRKHTTKAIEKYEEFTDKYLRHEVSLETVQRSEHLLKKMYLDYMVRGFMLDSGSIYSRATELAPVGFRATVLGAKQLVDNARTILRDINTKPYQHLKKYDDVIRKIATSSNISDTFMRANIAENMEVEHGVSLKKHLKNTFGVSDPGAIEKIMTGQQGIYAYSSRNPTIQSGYDAILDKKLHLIPPELAEELGMGINEVHVFAEHSKLFNMDFDGDQGEFVLKGFRTAQTLAGYNAEHSVQLSKAISGAMESTVKGGRRLKDKLSNFDFAGFRNGKMIVNTVDNQGFIIEKIIDVDSKEANNIMGGEDGWFGQFVKNLKTSQLQGHGIVSNQIVKQALDQVAFVGLSKEMIGLFTNINQIRTRQIMQVGKLGGNSVLAKSLLGNLNEGPAGLSQIFISLSKHPQDFQRLSQATKAIINPYTNDKFAQGSLKGVFQDMHGKEQGEEVYNTWKNSLDSFAMACPRREEVYNTFKAYENIDLMRDGTSILDEMATHSDDDFIKSKLFDITTSKSNVAELGDYLTKKFKLDTPSIRGVFKRGGKVAAITAAIYMAGNFFRPNQLSNSSNPLDGFINLGSDINGNTNAIASNMELDRSIPLDMVNASFSKEAYIKMNKFNKGAEDSAKTRLVENLLNKTFDKPNALIYDWRSSPNLSYSNYTQNIGSFGNSNTRRNY